MQPSVALAPRTASDVFFAIGKQKTFIIHYRHSRPRRRRRNHHRRSSASPPSLSSLSEGLRPMPPAPLAQNGDECGTFTSCRPSAFHRINTGAAGGQLYGFGRSASGFGHSMAPRWSQEAPGAAKMAPRWPQNGPRMAPRWPQDGPQEIRASRDTEKWLQKRVFFRCKTLFVGGG